MADGSRLHLLVTGDADLQCGYGIFPLSRSTHVHGRPEVGDQGRCVLVLVGADAPPPVTMVLQFAAPLRYDRMGIIQPNQPLALRPVQPERVVDAMWLPERHRYPRHQEPDPMAAVRVRHGTRPTKSRSTSRASLSGFITAHGYYTETTQTR